MRATTAGHRPRAATPPGLLLAGSPTAELRIAPFGLSYAPAPAPTDRPPDHPPAERRPDIAAAVPTVTTAMAPRPPAGRRGARRWLLPLLAVSAATLLGYQFWSGRKR